MKITRSQIRKIIKEAIGADDGYVSHMSMPPSTRQYVLDALEKGIAQGGPSRGRSYADIAMDHMSDNNFPAAVDAIMDSLSIDDPAEGAEAELIQDLMRVEGIEEIASVVAAWATRQFRAGHKI
mgnify:CR=1 FL=1